MKRIISLKLVVLPMEVALMISKKYVELSVRLSRTLLKYLRKTLIIFTKFL